MRKLNLLYVVENDDFDKRRSETPLNAKDLFFAVSLITMAGSLARKEYVSPKTVKTIPVNLPQGIYIVSVNGNKTNVKSKLIIK